VSDRTPKSLPLLWLSCAALMLAACAVGVGSQNRDAGSCNDNSDCDPGFHCVGTFCVSSNDGGVSGDGSTESPTISVSPQTLAFSEAAQGASEVQTVTITNIGVGTLTLTGVALDENDTTPEFTYLGPASSSLANGESTTIDVMLSPSDTALDSGQLTISSNDPSSPAVHVELLSSFIGTPDLTVCVDTGQPAPANCEEPPVVSYGQVSYASSAQSTFYMRNDGDGNKTITVEDLFLQAGTPSHTALYALDLFTMVENPPGSGTWQETPATTPYTLVSSGGLDPDPDALYGRLTFTANTDGFLILSGDVLQIITTDTDNAQPAYTTVPITATIMGCPPGLWDTNGNTADGCEYSCTQTNGGVELCDDLDNDCDGTVNDGLDEGGNTCSGPIPVSPLSDSSCNTTNISGTITSGDSDWYSISFTSGLNSTTFHARLEFTSPAGGGNFRMDVLLDNCSSPVTCESGTHTENTVMDWDIDSSSMGRCPSNTSCSHGIDARVRIYSVGSAQCAPYTFRASNGC
jgi:HYDIN/CFA65/VesB-like, Ig-like domain